MQHAGLSAISFGHVNSLDLVNLDRVVKGREKSLFQFTA